MLLLSTLFNASIFIAFYLFSLPYYEQWVGFIINFLMIAIMWRRYGLSVATQRLLSGEILPSIFYTIWLLFYPQSHALYTLPLFVSFVGKIYLLVSHPSRLEVDAVEELILLESKIQIFLTFYHPLGFLCQGNFAHQQFLGMIFFLLTMKLKYSIHYGTRKAYEQFHFALDRISKFFNFRKSYQFVQSLFIHVNGHSVSPKHITY